jgi:hypothetical protein
LRTKRWIIYLVGAVALILCAGCGWSSGEPFSGDYADFDPETYNALESVPITAVQAWFASMEFIRSPNEEGVMVPNKELGRNFDLWLTVVNPVFLQDQEGQFIGMDQVEELLTQWNDPGWEVEFLEITTEEASNDGREARVELISGSIRYIGEFFDSPEWRQDSFGDKKGEIYLSYYEDTVNDPLQYIPGFEDIAGKGRWVVIGGLDFSEDEPWGEQVGS